MESMVQALKEIATNLRPFDSLLVRSQANAGSAGGTIYYLTLGTLKVAFGKTTSFSTGSGAVSAGVVTLPSGFFTAAPMGYVTLLPSTTNDQTAQVVSESTTAITLNLYNHSGVLAGGVMNWLALGF